MKHLGKHKRIDLQSCARKIFLRNDTNNKKKTLKRMIDRMLKFKTSAQQETLLNK